MGSTTQNYGLSSMHSQVSKEIKQVVNGDTKTQEKIKIRLFRYLGE